MGSTAAQKKNIGYHSPIPMPATVSEAPRALRLRRPVESTVRPTAAPTDSTATPRMPKDGVVKKFARSR